MNRISVLVAAVVFSLVSLCSLVEAQKKSNTSDAQYIAKALSAAPAAVAKHATVVKMDESGKMTTLREGKNGFTCMVAGGNKMCADANSMAFLDAWMKHQPTTDKLGMIYMLAGDDGASNTDPFATGKTADNHWVVTGPHVMIVGAGAKSLGLSSAKDADPSGPYMMWSGTPYEHAMIPVGGAKAAAAAKAGEMEMKK
jgi:hypothetical protein